jgi:hypothetical protein
VPHLASFLKHLEGQVPNQTRSIDRDGDVCQSEEEDHNVDWGDAVSTYCPIVHFLSTNGQNGEQKEICYQGRRDKVHRKHQSHVRFDFAILIIVVILVRTPCSWRYYSQATQAFQDNVPNWPRNIDPDMEREKYNDICVIELIPYGVNLSSMTTLTCEYEDDECNDRSPVPDFIGIKVL